MAKTYGFVKCRVVSEPHIKGSREKGETQYHLHVSLAVPNDRGGNDTWDVAVNVGTNDADDLLRYRLVLDYHHPIVTKLRAAKAGFTNLTSSRALPALDFMRSDVLAETGKWRDSDVMDGGDDREPYKSLARLLEKAQKARADVYVFGRTYEGGDLGIHDIHMNQGSTGSFINHGNDSNDHDDVWQDGAVLVDFGEGEQSGLSAYFTAFTQQKVPTDDLGNPKPDAHEITDRDPGTQV
ncbi:MAG TPA: DUF2278 family protein [Polyangiaceae bacterium]|jgi:uncharacterized protein YukJ|nr:DUF2278 family protein [Polyangiaceae bacterium]